MIIIKNILLIKFLFYCELTYMNTVESLVKGFYFSGKLYVLNTVQRRYIVLLNIKFNSFILIKYLQWCTEYFQNMLQVQLSLTYSPTDKHNYISKYRNTSLKRGKYLHK